MMKTIVIFFLTSKAILAQTPLEKLLVVGLQKSFGLKIQKLRSEQSEIALTNSYAALLPTLSLSAGRSIDKAESFESGAKTSATTKSNTLSMSANWTVWDHFKNITNIQTTRLSDQVQKITDDKVIQNYVLETLSSYLDYQLLYNQERVLKIREEQAMWANKKSQELVAVGAKTKVDSYDTEIEVANVQRELLELQNKLATARRNLQFKLDPDNKTPILREKFLEFRPYFMDVFEEVYPQIKTDWLEKFKKGNRDLVVARINLQKSSIELGQQKWNYWPQLGLSVKHDINLNGYVVENTPSNEKSPLHTTGVALSLSWEVWDWFTKDRNLIVSKKNQRISEIEYRNTQQRTKNEIIEFIQSYEILLESIKASKLILEKAQKQYSFSQEMYNLGKITIYALQQSITRLFQAEITLANRLKEKFVLSGKILFSVGYDLLPKI